MGEPACARVAPRAAGTVEATDDAGYYSPGSVATLKATPATGSTFTGWTGCDAPAADQPAEECAVTMDAVKGVQATFTQSFKDGTVTADPVRDGRGAVVSDPGAIDCRWVPDASGENCSDDFAGGDTVTLTAAPETGSRFTGFEGCPQVDGATCTLVVDGDLKVSAAFERATGTGGGAIGGGGGPTAPPAGGGDEVAGEVAGDPSFEVVNRTGLHKHLDLVMTCGTVGCTPSAAASLHFGGARVGDYLTVTPRLAAKATITVRLRTSRPVRRALRRSRDERPVPGRRFASPSRSGSRTAGRS